MDVPVYARLCRYSSGETLMPNIEVIRSPGHSQACSGSSRLLRQASALLEAAARVDGHEPVGEHKFLRVQRAADLTSALLAFDGEQLAGYAQTVTYGDGDARRTSCEFVVHPRLRRRGVGRALLGEAIAHAQALGARQVDLWAYNASPVSTRIAGQFGFRPARRLLHLHRHMRSLPDAALLAGAAIRSFRPGADEELWLDLNRRVFAAHPEQGRWTMDDLRARMAQPWFDPTDFLLLEIDGAPAGFCWLKVEDRRGEGRVGEIYVIGTVPEFQGRGLGRALLARGLARLRERAVDVAAIYVDESNAPAVHLYESVGFHYHHVDVCFTRRLDEERVPVPAEAAA